jgi:hypothetical protein
MCIKLYTEYHVLSTIILVSAYTPCTTDQFDVRLDTRTTPTVAEHCRDHGAATRLAPAMFSDSSFLQFYVGNGTVINDRMSWLNV